jgi:hypothetical protein
VPGAPGGSAPGGQAGSAPAAQGQSRSETALRDGARGERGSARGTAKRTAARAKAGRAQRAERAERSAAGSEAGKPANGSQLALAESAAATTSVAAQAPDLPDDASPESLPFTGLQLALLALIGIAALVSGTGLRGGARSVRG